MRFVSRGFQSVVGVIGGFFIGMIVGAAIGFIFSWLVTFIRIGISFNLLGVTVGLLIGLGMAQITMVFNPHIPDLIGRTSILMISAILGMVLGYLVTSPVGGVIPEGFAPLAVLPPATIVGCVLGTLAGFITGFGVTGRDKDEERTNDWDAFMKKKAGEE